MDIKQYKLARSFPPRLVIFLLALWGFTSSMNAQSPKREFRGAWIATVKNIDWPSQAKLYADVQAGEFTDLLDRLQAVGINAVIVQIRPSGDAFYPSAYEPWSEWLTGEQGSPPEPYYDPLDMMIAEAHSRGMEFHAWFNPYRADMDWEEGKLRAENHVSQTHPEWTLQYGRNLYIDPGIPDAQDYVLGVVLDVVKHNPIDAVHFDDYFYPYRIADTPFPDTSSFAFYGAGFPEVDDWRRYNVNTFIQRLSDSIRYVNPEVQFGISPFGVWRNIADDPEGSDTRAGQTSYDDLYADIRLWLRNGWIDYVAPQAYWSIGYPPAAFDVIVEWWSANCYGKRLYIGHGPYKIANNADKNWDDPTQIPRQIRQLRENEAVDGSIFFSSRWFDVNPLGFADSLQNYYYRRPALIPTVQKGDPIPPVAPSEQEIRIVKKGVQLSWQKSLYGDSVAYYVIYRSEGHELPTLNASYIYKVQGGDQTLFLDKRTRFLKRYHYIVTAVDRQHNESAPSEISSKIRWTGFLQRWRKQ
ncbi:MAG: family 10 glycosylhydrolase [Bacteroidota bacterium]